MEDSARNVIHRKDDELLQAEKLSLFAANISVSKNFHYSPYMTISILSCSVMYETNYAQQCSAFKIHPHRHTCTWLHTCSDSITWLQTDEPCVQTQQLC